MKTVFHLSTNSSDKVSEMLGNIKNLWDDNGADMESTAAVLNADAVKIAEQESEASEFLESMVEAGLDLKICSNSLGGIEADRDEMIEGIEVVSSGVGEINRLQEDGYNYIRI